MLKGATMIEDQDVTYGEKAEKLLCRFKGDSYLFGAEVLVRVGSVVSGLGGPGCSGPGHISR